MVEEVRPASWIELMDIVFDDSWDEGKQRFRSSYAFRGVSEASYHLETSLERHGGSIEHLEWSLLRNFRKYGREVSASGLGLWELMALGQHHGLPTRLLDWTFSPYVALHFATDRPATGVETAVWMVNIEDAHRDLPDPLEQLLRAESAYVFTVEMLEALAESPEGERRGTSLDRRRTPFSATTEPLAVFDRLGNDGSFLVFFEPPSVDARIVNQYGLFSVMPVSAESIEDWIEAHPGSGKKVIIPAEIVWEVRDKLDQANITERVLFPGLDGLAQWLRRHYSAG